MTLSRIALLTAAAGFTGFGLACTIAPEKMLDGADVRPRNARGKTELRAMYGGMEPGLGAFFIVATQKPGWKRPALAAQALGLGGLAAARLGGILGDRPRGKLMPLLCVFEGAAAGIAGAALLKDSREKKRTLRAA